MEASSAGAAGRVSTHGTRRAVPPPVSSDDWWDAERKQTAFVLACLGLVCASVFAVPVVFLGGRPPAGSSGGFRLPAWVRVEGDPGASAALPGVRTPLPERDLDAVAEDDGSAPALPPPPPPQTISDVCRRLPGYGTVFQEPVEGEDGVKVVEGTFGRRTVYELLQASTRDVGAIGAIQQAVRRDGLFDFRRIRPDDRFRLFVDGDGRVRMFEYAPSDTEVFHVVRAGESSFVAHRVDVPIENRVTRAAGTVEGTLARSLTGAGLDASIVPLLADIFSFSVNFSRDVRPGDQFRLVVEERYIGGRFQRYTRVLAFDYQGRVIGNVRAYGFEIDGKIRYFSAEGESLQRVLLAAPCRYEAISSRYDPNRMHPVLHRRVPHEGIDLVAPTGTPVYAIADGTLAFHGEKGPNGNLVVIEHAGEMLSYYAHLSAYAAGLRDGQALRRGQLVGYVGNTGRSTGPHLHFGIKVRGDFVDPEAYIKSKRGTPVPAGQRDAFQARVVELDAQLAQLGAAPDAPVVPDETGPEVGLVPVVDAAP